jgi:glyoxylase I family protein
MSQIKFAHVAFSCKDIVKIEKFYCKHFGFKRSRFIPLGENNCIVFLKNDENVYLELFIADAENPFPKVDSADGPHYSTIRHTAFQVEDIDKKIQEMGNDAVVTLGPLDFSDFIKGWKTVWVKDPEGNIVEISQGYEDQVNPPQLS